jgi:hypothetical protein
MGNANKGAVFGGSLSEMYDDAQPIPLFINVCLKYLAQIKLTEPLEMTGLEKALTAVGFIADDDNPDASLFPNTPNTPGPGAGGGGFGAPSTPLRGSSGGGRGFSPGPTPGRSTPSRTGFTSSPIPHDRKKIAKTMTLVRPEKKLRQLLKVVKQELNDREYTCTSTSSARVQWCSTAILQQCDSAIVCVRVPVQAGATPGECGWSEGGSTVVSGCW